MRLHHARFILFVLLLNLFLDFLLALMIAVPVASAKDKLVVYGDNVTVYTGPGKMYRPLTIFRSEAEVEVQYAPETIKSGTDEFYKVIVRLSTKKKAIGYISVDEQVRKKSDAESADDFDSFDEFPRAQRAYQISYSHLKTQRSIATLGYVQYIGPGFYLKEFAGAFRTTKHTIPLFGLEFGNDGVLHKNLSGFISYGAGLLWRPKDDAVFPGNKDDFSNLLVQGALGARLNFGSSASIALGGTQAVLFSSNNSLVTWGLIAIVEVGL